MERVKKCWEMGRGERLVKGRRLEGGMGESIKKREEEGTARRNDERGGEIKKKKEQQVGKKEREREGKN